MAELVTKKTLPEKSIGLKVNERLSSYMLWKHATFGSKLEDTKEDVEWKANVQKLVDQHKLLVNHWAAADTFFSESNKVMIQNEVLMQCLRDTVADDEVKEYFYGPAY